MIMHVGTFRWRAEMPDEELELVTEAFVALGQAVPSLRSFSFGSNVALSPTANADFGLVATFDDEAGFHEYNVHPEHDRLRAVIRPWIASASGLQYTA
jgi:hypothetical protein